jgi:hypothetical protein
MTKQAERYRLAITGEFFVAAQLQRLGISATVTYGNAKRADIVAVNRETGRAVTIEVKSTNKNRWPVGNRVPLPSQQPWVFVHIPDNMANSPEFFVILQNELHQILAPIEAEYWAKYKVKHGRAYGDNTPGVAAAKLNQLLPFKDNWAVILTLLAA